MCGRYALTLPPEALRALFKVLGEDLFPPRYNIAPTQPIHVVATAADRRRELVLMRWGFVPSWVKDPAKFPLLINARIESAADKPAFRNAVRRRRCLVPATGFYEWQKRPEGGKQPYLIKPAAPPVVAFAGIHETWIGPDGEEVDTAAILTRAATPSLAGIHDRMPAVVPEALFDDWLDPLREDGAAVLAALPAPADDLFERIAISSRINAAANEGPQLQEPVDPQAVAADTGKAGAGRRARAERDDAATQDRGQLDLF